MTPSVILYPLGFDLRVSDLDETLELPSGCVMNSSAMDGLRQRAQRVLEAQLFELHTIVRNAAEIKDYQIIL